MSKPSRRFAAPAVLLVAALVPRLVSAAEAPLPEPRLDAYVTTDQTPYFALSLSPNAAVAQGGPRDVVIVFDTSASQTGVFREKALEALAVLLQGLNRADRVRLLAVDLEAIALSPAFAPPQSDETLRAMAALKQRAPLGATDLPEALRAAAAGFDAQSKSPRVLVYLGDGMSAARFLVLDEYQHLVEALVGERISVSSYAVGPRVDSALLAALANTTGGLLAIDGETATAKQCGAFLAAGVRGTVIWPTKMSWPQAFVEVYPSRMPPLRTDRDTIVLGKSAAGKLSGELTVAMSAQVGGKPRAFQWTLAPGASNPDFAFLPVLVEGAKSDGGAR
ncbi:MAG: VWA domain-containing protein, partial [Pirellulales bacterium]